MVQPQKIPEEYIRTTVTSNVAERLQIINQQVLSRTKLIEVIDRYKLYRDKAKVSSQDELAEHMRGNITVSMKSNVYFNITYSYSDPYIAAKVTNTLASMYVDYNIKLRSQDASGTTVFLERELEQRRKELSSWESKISQFKKEHLDELPEARDVNINLLGQLQLRLSSVNENLQSERSRLALIENSIKLEEDVLLSRQQQNSTNQENYSGALDLSLSPEILQRKLEKLQKIYTDNHPDVRRIKELLLKSHSGVDINRDSNISENAKEASKVASKKSRINFRSSSVDGSKRIKVEDAKRRIQQYESEAKRLRARIEEVQIYIEKAPEVAESLQELTRGYDSLKTSFENLQNKAIEAKMAYNLERSQRGEQFELIDPAQPPYYPSIPNPQKAIPISLGIALAAALGLAILMDQLDGSFTNIGQIESLSKLPVLAVVPNIIERKHKKKIVMRNTVFATIYVTASLCMLALMAAIYMNKATPIKVQLVNMIKLVL